MQVEELQVGEGATSRVAGGQVLHHAKDNHSMVCREHQHAHNSISDKRFFFFVKEYWC